MRNNLAADTICKPLAHADLYNMTEFKKEAIKFICLNANSVISVSCFNLKSLKSYHFNFQSDGFINLTKSNPHLIADIMSTLANDRHSSPSYFTRDGSCKFQGENDQNNTIFSVEPLNKRARMTETNI